MILNIYNCKQIMIRSLKKDVSKQNHSFRVARMSLLLCRKFKKTDLTKNAVMASLMHDVGKRFTREEMLEYAEFNDLDMSDFERYDNQAALHGKIGADLFGKYFGRDKENDKRQVKQIQKAIESHVAGSKEPMTDLEKIVFIADNIEIERGYLSDILVPLIKAEKISMNECMLKIIECKEYKAQKARRVLNPLLLDTKENILREMQKKRPEEKEDRV